MKSESARSVCDPVFWDQRYRAADTPWDKGQPHPSLAEVLTRMQTSHEGVLEISRVLVPGCGRGHDARALAARFPEVLAVDFSPKALAEAERHVAKPPGLRFAEADFLAPPDEWMASFDLIFEHTCFCAIEPASRSQYVEACRKILRPGGLLAGFFFTGLERENGPPFGSPPSELQDLFGAEFLLVAREPVRKTFAGREGAEEFWLWRKNNS